ncbi:MAG: UDP-N-acetylmuramoyl-L-alanine--D-glutamate ligase [Pseudomonadales bacterium]|nr:UDP-N-acetylmuramoyl-L-alanine--D-glutamate ligase [Pseudomonadales bacterium]
MTLNQDKTVHTSNQDKTVHTSWLVLGLGISGYSCVKYLSRIDANFTVMDSREHPPMLDQLIAEFPEVPYIVGVDLSSPYVNLDQVQTVVISPGISVDNAVVDTVIKNGGRVVGDIELFSREVTAPIVAITGSNAKTTVTTLVGEMAKEADIAVGVGGNIGTPVLDLLEQDKKQLYVLELSSFQLETTENLNAAVATILNLSDDHMDRYGGIEGYKKAKQKIFSNCLSLVINRGQPDLVPVAESNKNSISFGLDKPCERQLGLIKENGVQFIAYENSKLISTDDLKIEGEHNFLNAMAAIALGMLVEIPTEKMIRCLKKFKGLPHRCEWVANIDNVQFFNDSKATNVGACIAALTGLGKSRSGKILLVAGGDGKGSDFSPLIEPVSHFVSNLFLFGRDAKQLERQLHGTTAIFMVKDLTEAVELAWQHAQPGDLVLLSPACASLDMFDNYQQRGDQFKELVYKIEAAA